MAGAHFQAPSISNCDVNHPRAFDPPSANYCWSYIVDASTR